MSAATTQHPWWRRRRLLVLGAVVLAVAGSVTGVLLATSSDEDASPTRFGAQFSAGGGASTDGAVVRLPGGTLTISLDRAPTAKPKDGRGRETPAPDGGRFVMLGWRGVSQPGLRIQTKAAVARPVTITLVTAGRRFPLLVGAATSRQLLPNGTAWVAVPGDATDARVEVGYDGVVQRVDPARKTVEKGRAALLYATASDGGVDCEIRATGSQRVDERSRPKCEVTASRTAYVEGPGWAPSGRAWLVLSTRLELLSHVVDGGSEYFLHRPGTVAFRYAGRTVTPAGVGGPPGPDFGYFSSALVTPTVVTAVAARPGAAQPLVATVQTTGTDETDDGTAIDTVPVTLTATAAVA